MNTNEKLMLLAAKSLKERKFRLEWAVVKTSPVLSMEFQIITDLGLKFAFFWKDPPKYVFKDRKLSEAFFREQQEYIGWAIYEKLWEGSVKIALKADGPTRKGYVGVQITWEDETVHDCEIKERYLLECEDYSPSK